MDRVKIFKVLPQNEFAASSHAATLIVLVAFLLVVAMQPRAYAITLNMTYFNEGDPVPHDENPMWDPDGSILKSHFQAAKVIWESLLPGGGSYDFDFEWDDDLDANKLGVTHRDPLKTFIEMNPNQPWFADATPGQNAEFGTTPTQTLYGQLSASDQTLYFPGTNPPFTLETRFNLFGNTDGLGLGGYNAQDGYDLLTVILHEIGHVLAITDGSGDFSISPQHVGGANGVLVQRNVDHLGGDPIVPGFLMNVSTLNGRRVLPSATDVLAIAADQDISQVHLARVGRISNGVWSDTNGWIGGGVPGITQDVYVRLSSVTLDTDAQAKSLSVGALSDFHVQNHRLTVPGTLSFDTSNLSVDAGGTVEADKISADALVAGAGSLVRFNNLTRGPTSSATSITFGGSVAIGYNAGSTISETFAPADYDAWTVGENLTIGDQKGATLAINRKTWTVGGNVYVGGNGAGTLTLQSSSLPDGILHVGGNLEVRGTDNGDVSSVLVSDSLADLHVSGHIIVGPRGAVTLRNQNPPETTYEVRGSATSVAGGPNPSPYFFQYSTGGALTFEGSSNTVFVRNSTINVEGGSGHDASGGMVTIGHAAGLYGATTIHTSGGRSGPNSLYLAGLDEAGKGGQVRFESFANAGNATIVNDGVTESRAGTGGLTVFADSSNADIAQIHNHGATVSRGGGGATQFRNSSNAERANIFNHADATFVYPSMSANTLFYDSSKAGHAIIENESGLKISNAPGRTEFRNNSSAADSTINNRGNPAFGGGVGGLTEFYDTATAERATLNLYEGFDKSGSTEFYNQSTAANATITIINTDPLGGSVGGGGGNLTFHDNSTADHAYITLKAGACCNGVKFKDHSTAASATIIQRDGSGRIEFTENATAGNASFSVEGDDEITFFNQSTAANANIALAIQARLLFTHDASAGQSQIEIAGALAPGSFNFGGIKFNLNATAGNSTIIANGGSAAGATGARVSFVNGAHAGNATITARGGINGGAGAIVSFFSGATGNTAQLIANADGTFDFGDQRTYGGTQVGSIEGAGSFVLNGSLLTTGNRNLNTTVSGPIVNGYLAGGALTKVGTGQLTLAGTNTYSGLTTVNAGAVSVTGSIAGGAVINTGGTLNGTGSIGGRVTVNSGGVFAPGTSPGTITLGGLTMATGGTLNFEIGDPARDHIMLTNNGNVLLAGSLNVSLLGGFTPTLGQSFSVFEGSVGSITGAFNSIVAPTFNGLTFGVMQNAGSVLLQVIPAAGSGASSDLESTTPEPAGWQLVCAAMLLRVAFGRAPKNPRYRLRLPSLTTRRALPCVAR